MNIMVYQYRNHLPVLFGAGAVSLLGEKVREFGCKKVMCVCDAGVRKSGIADKATASLEAAGIGYVVFDQITSDPTDLAVDTGGEIARKEGVDAVVGIGGGSSMDAAKAISLLIEHEPPIRQYMSMPPVMTESTVPLILVPTTSGTGSEVTLVGIITNTQNHEKEAVALQAALAVLDPELCRTAPPSVTAYTGLDALSHALEAITARRRNPFSEHIACGAISKIMRSLPAAYQNGNDLEARTELALASNWAGIALVDTDCHFGHCLAEGIASTFSLPHGVACAVTMIATIRMAAAVVPDKVRLIGEAMGLTFASDAAVETMESAVIDALCALIRRVGMKSLKEMGYSRDEVIATAQIAANNGMRFSSPMDISLAYTEEMLGWVYDKYQ